MVGWYSPSKKRQKDDRMFEVEHSQSKPNNMSIGGPTTGKKDDVAKIEEAAVGQQIQEPEYKVTEAQSEKVAEVQEDKTQAKKAEKKSSVYDSVNNNPLAFIPYETLFNGFMEIPVIYYNFEDFKYTLKRLDELLPNKKICEIYNVFKKKDDKVDINKLCYGIKHYYDLPVFLENIWETWFKLFSCNELPLPDFRTQITKDGKLNEIDVEIIIRDVNIELYITISYFQYLRSQNTEGGLKLAKYLKMYYEESEREIRMKNRLQRRKKFNNSIGVDKNLADKDLDSNIDLENEFNSLALSNLTSEVYSTKSLIETYNNYTIEPLRIIKQKLELGKCHCLQIMPILQKLFNEIFADKQNIYVSNFIEIINSMNEIDETLQNISEICEILFKILDIDDKGFISKMDTFVFSVLMVSGTKYEKIMAIFGMLAENDMIEINQLIEVLVSLMRFESVSSYSLDGNLVKRQGELEVVLLKSKKRNGLTIEESATIGACDVYDLLNKNREEQVSLEEFMIWFNHDNPEVLRNIEIFG